MADALEAITASVAESAVGALLPTGIVMVAVFETAFKSSKAVKVNVSFPVYVPLGA